MTSNSTTKQFDRTVFGTGANVIHGDERDTGDQSELTIIILLIAAGLVLTAAFFAVGFGAEFGRILATSG
jgi:hypothetical protein